MIPQKQRFVHASSRACAVSCHYLKKYAIVATKFNWRELGCNNSIVLQLCGMLWCNKSLTLSKIEKRHHTFFPLNIFAPDPKKFNRMDSQTSYVVTLLLLRHVSQTSVRWLLVVAFHLNRLRWFFSFVFVNVCRCHDNIVCTPVERLSHLRHNIGKIIARFEVSIILSGSWSCAGIAFWCLVIVPQKYDVSHGRTHNDACALQRFDWDRRIYLLRVGCCISLAQLSRHMDTMTLSDYSDSQCWYCRPADLLGLRWCCVRRR